MELDIPVWVDDYNHNMNSVDLANQFRQAYDTQQIAYRNWLPLLHWILDQAAINAYKLGTFGKTWTAGHVNFRRELCRQLLSFSKCQVWKNPGAHNWVVRPTRQSCVWCCKFFKFKKQVLEAWKKVGIELIQDELGDKRLSKS